MDVVAVETLVPDLHIGAERVDGGKILDREADRFRRGREATIAEPLRTCTYRKPNSWPSTGESGDACW
jgi:hypothetical protein